MCFFLDLSIKVCVFFKHLGPSSFTQTSLADARVTAQVLWELIPRSSLTVQVDQRR